MAATYTHVGWLGVRAYQSFDAYWHGDGPKPTKVHACRVATRGRHAGRHVSLCGKPIVPGDAGDMFEDDGYREAGAVTTVVPAEAGHRITCRSCRRRIEGARR